MSSTEEGEGGSLGHRNPPDFSGAHARPSSLRPLQFTVVLPPLGRPSAGSLHQPGLRPGRCKIGEFAPSGAQSGAWSHDPRPAPPAPSASGVLRRTMSWRAATT